MQNDLTKTMPVLICAETCQKGMFLRKYIIGVAPGLFPNGSLSLQAHVYIFSAPPPPQSPPQGWGWIGVIQNSRRTPHGYDLRVEVHCEKGKLVAEDERQTKIWRYDEAGIHGDYYYYFMERFEDAYRQEIQVFVDTIAKGEATKPGTQDAIETLRVAVAATKSLREGRPVLIAEI